MDAEVLTVFTDDMLVRHTTVASECYSWWRDDYTTEDESRDADHPVTVVRLMVPGSVIAARLDLMGITVAEVITLLEESISEQAEWSRESATADGDISVAVFEPL